MERVTRIELALSAWEADVLPLNYTRGRRPDYLAARRAWSSPPISPVQLVSVAPVAGPELTFPRRAGDGGP